MFGRILLLLVLSASAAHSERLRSGFVSPTFGGNPILNSYLMTRAENFRPAAVVPEVEERTQADYFLEQLQRRALSTLSTGILSELSDPSGTQSGSYYFDDFTLGYDRVDDEIVVSITSGSTVTEITLPSYTFEAE